MTALIERAVEDGDWPLAWKLMETDHFSCGKFNILRNGIPDIISIYHDKVKKLTLKVQKTNTSPVSGFS